MAQEARPFTPNPKDLNERFVGAIKQAAAVTWATHPEDVAFAFEESTLTAYAENEEGDSFHAVVTIEGKEIHIDVRMKEAD